MVILLVSWLALPLWIERQGVSMASEQLGRPVTLEAAHFNPWRLRLTLDGLRVAGQGGGGGSAPQAEDLLSIKQVTLVLSPRSILHFAPILSSLRVDTPVVRLALLGEGRTNVDDILARLKAPAAPEPTKPAKEPALALYNIELIDGNLQLDDRHAGMVHRLSALKLGVPFLSTLDADVEVQVQPHLSGQLNGVPFQSEAQALPFAQTRHARLRFKLDALDLAAYRPYWPRMLPMRLASGLVDAQLAVDFRQPASQPPELKITGQADLRALSLQRRIDGAEPTWEDWLRWKQLSVTLADVQPLKRQVLLDRLALDNPELRLSRDEAGKVWWPSSSGEPATASATASAHSPSNAAASAPAAAASSAGWRFGLRQVEVAQGRLEWRDASVTPAAHWRAEGLNLKGRGVAWPVVGPAASLDMTASIHLLDPPKASASAADGAAWQAKGQVGPNGIAVNWSLDRLSLAGLVPYLAPITPLTVSGQLAMKGELKAGARGEQLRAGLRDVRLSGVQWMSAGQAVAALDELNLDQADVALATSEVSLGRLVLRQPQVQLARDATGRWNWSDWVRTGDAAVAPRRSGGAGKPVLRLSNPEDDRPATTAAAASAPAPGTTSASPWRVRLAELVVEGGQVRLTDQFTHVLDDQSVRPIGVQDLAIRVAGVAWDGHQLQQALPVRLSLVARRPDAPRRGNRELARLQWEGQLALDPLRLKGKLQAEHLPLHWADPYLDPSIGIHLQRAEGSFKGDMALAMLPAGPRLQAMGDLELAELRLRQARLQEGRRRSAEDLLSWQALRLAGFKLQMAPAGVPDVAIRLASLDEFYARLIVNEQGRLNLRDLRQTEQGQAVAATAGTAAASAPVAAIVAAATSAPAPDARADAAPVPAPASAGAQAGPPLRLSIEETRVNAGRVDFTDRFVKPNYSAQLSELTGTLGSFAAGSNAMAPLQLRGRVAGTGLLDISGQLNPSGAPLALDITASATDIELAPLSPYAGKYAGYAIERGKLSSRVHYQIDPSGRLVADNKVVLNQLSFGERIDSPVATKLPVRLAVALLKDRNGVIDVNLPVSGSINDPEFSVGGVVVKLVVNLLTKALTAPFSLLSGGGGTDMSHLEFAPGTSALLPETERGLDQVAKVLTEKPSLQLSITGWVDPAGERRAAQAARLEEALVAERRRELRRQQTPEAAAAAASAAASGSAGGQPAITLDDAQRQRLLKAVYESSKLPTKPRNMLGLSKDLPPQEMRALLMDSYTVTDEQMRELALQRSVVVRDALIAKGVPNERLFLASPKLHEAGEGQQWQPKVDLALSTQ